MTRTRHGAARSGGRRGFARNPAVWVSATLIQITVLTTSDAAVASPDHMFDWPLRPRPEIARSFDPPEQDWLSGHRGVDLAGIPGRPVYAAGPGIVVFAGEVAGRPVVSIRHEGGLRTTYEPVDAEITVGRRVSRATRIGVLRAGHPGCAAVACLHWGLRRENANRAKREYLNPLGLLRLVPVRLKPVTAWARAPTRTG